MADLPNLRVDAAETKDMEALAGRRVLVIDDNAAYLKIWRELLATLGARPALAQSPAEALKLLRSDRFALVIVDQHLSDDECTGADIVALIRQQRTMQTPETPVLACTSDTTETTLAQLLRAGVDGVLEKPIDVLATIGTLAQIRPAA